MRFTTNTWFLPRCLANGLKFAIAGIVLAYLFIAAVYLSYALTGQDPFSLAIVVFFVLLAVALWRMTKWARSGTVLFLWVFLLGVALEGILRNLLSVYYKYSGLEKLDPNQTMAQFLFYRLLFLCIAFAFFAIGYRCIQVLDKHRDEFQKRLI